VARPDRMTTEEVVRKLMLDEHADVLRESLKLLVRELMEIELQIPKLREGRYFPSFLRPRKRSEQALVAVVQQAYVCGVSTRRVDQLVESLGLRVSRSEVSRICALLDEQVEAFRQRPLEGATSGARTRSSVSTARSGGAPTSSGSSPTTAR
jgi:putative transposase